MVLINSVRVNSNENKSYNFSHTDGGREKCSPFERGGGRKKCYPVLRGGGGKKFWTCDFPILVILFWYYSKTVLGCKKNRRYEMGVKKIVLGGRRPRKIIF